MSMRRSLPRIALTLVLAAIAGWAVLHRDQINLATLDAWLAWLGPWAPIGHMMLFALGTVAFVPGVVFSLAGGALFGPLWGSLWNLAGATLGATLAFLVARYIAGEWVARNAGALPIASPRPSNAVLERPTGRFVTPARTGKEGMQADGTVSRPATVSAMTNARGWTIFAGFIVSWLLLATVVVISAKYWT